MELEIRGFADVPWQLFLLLSINSLDKSHQQIANGKQNAFDLWLASSNTIESQKWIDGEHLNSLPQREDLRSIALPARFS